MSRYNEWALVKCGRPIISGMLVLLGAALAPGARAAPRVVLGPERVELHRPADGITAIVQTSDGYLWLASDRGVVRFDGARFQFVERLRGGAQHRRVTALARARDGGIYFALRPDPGATQVSHFARGELSRVDAPPGQLSGEVLSLLEDDRGVLWIGTTDGLVTKQGATWTTLGPAQGLGARSTSALLDEGGGRVWVGNSRGLYRATAAGRFEVVWEGARVHDLSRDGQGRIWAATSRFGAIVVENGTPRVLAKTPGESHVALAVSADARGGVWIGTDKGLGRRVGDDLVLFDAERFPDARAEALAEDREGNIWVGTAAGGLIKIKTTQPLYTIGTTEGLTGRTAYSIAADRQGGVWITTDEGLSRWQDGRLTFHGGPDEARQDFGSLAVRRDGTVWVTSRKAGVYRLKDDRFTHMEAAHGMPAGGAGPLFEDSRGRLWIGLAEGGVVALEGTRGRVFEAKIMGCPSPVSAIAEDTAGDLWFASDGGGLCRFEHGRDSFRHYGSKEGLPTLGLDALTFDRDGVLWIGTRAGGLLRFVNGRFTQLSEDQGLKHEHVANIIEDGAGHPWLTSLAGLFRLDKREVMEVMDGRRDHLEPLSFGVEDGMRTRHCLWRHTPGAIRTPDGAIWIPTAQGVSVLAHPERLPATPIAEVIMERVEINGTRFPLASADLGRLPTGRGNLEFEFTAPRFSNANRIGFKYQLAGFDDGWIAAGERRSASYTNVAPGRYTFTAVAFATDGSGAEKRATVNLTLTPPLHRSRPFLVAAGVVAVALAVGAFRVRRWRGERRAALVAEERNRIARDMHDTLEQSFVAIKLQLEAAAGTDAPAAQGHLARANELLERARAEARQSIWALRAGTLGAADLPMALSVMAGQTLRGTAVKFELSVRGDVYRLVPVAEHSVVRVVQEAMTNALKHGAAKTIVVELRFGEQGLGLTVRDDGSGFDNQPEAPPVPASDGHFGLLGMRERVAELGGDIVVRGRPQQGTEIDLSIPARWRRAQQPAVS